MSSTHSLGGAHCFHDAAEVQEQVMRAVRGAWHAMAGGRHQHHEDRHHHEEMRGRGGPHEHRHRGRGGPFPFDFGGSWGGGPGFPFGGGRGRGFRGRKAKRGDVRAAILALLAEEPRNGYQIIQEIAARSQGGWKPSPGAVYPALQQLTDEGLVRSEESDGRKTFQLTEAGRDYVAAHPDETGAPWEEMKPDLDDPTWELMDLARQSGFAMLQILQTGTPAQVRQAREVLVDGRRRLYQILADGDPEAE
ncbi:DNA-binding transcriptional regulator, PadR family [Sinosporangium album]|uniref:DNA-binding transcriptional regulator, PadR family n=1 Tax=Sinosporangium album TaxID=504805 RepID=A0A1G8BI39_9ACTN|nr:PadR family transcriptional regulator [Sinosporangium album]SDH32896.1 DNA-binding transcriptional regulator, PadR family [Sinosporangium album]